MTEQKESLTTTQEKPKDRLDQLVDQYNAAVRKYEQETSPEQKRKDLKEFRKQRRKAKRQNRVYPWTGTSFWDFLVGLFKVLFYSPIFLVLFAINLLKMIIGVFITWIVGKFAILLIVGFGGMLITIPFPNLELPIANVMTLCGKWFFNMNLASNTISSEGMTLFPGGMIEVSIMLLLAVIGAVGATINPD